MWAAYYLTAVRARDQDPDSGDLGLSRSGGPLNQGASKDHAQQVVEESAISSRAPAAAQTSRTSCIGSD
jgi:hypothetical protein